MVTANIVSLTDDEEGRTGMAEASEPMTTEEFRAWVEDKATRGVKDIRVASVAARMPLPAPALGLEEREASRDRAAHELARQTIRARSGARTKYYTTVEGRRIKVEGEIVGTAEAAAILGVERPRMGRYRGLKQLPPLQMLAAGPIWLRSDVEAFSLEVEARRKHKKTPEEALPA